MRHRIDDILDALEVRPTIHQDKALKLNLPKFKYEVYSQPLDIENLAIISEKELNEIVQKLELATDKLNKKLLQKIMPLLLSYKTSTAYTKAVMQEGLGLDVEFEVGIEEAIKTTGYLSILSHFIINAELPSVIKRRFLTKASDQLAEVAVKKILMKQGSGNNINQLYGMVIKKSDSQIDSKTIGVSKRRQK